MSVEVDIKFLATTLSGNLNLPEIDLKWTPDPGQAEFGDVHGPADTPPTDPNRPLIFNEIKGTLGLELQAEKGQVDVPELTFSQQFLRDHQFLHIAGAFVDAADFGVAV